VEKRLKTSEKWEKVVTLDTSITQHCIGNLKEKSEWIFRVFAENPIGLSQPALTESVKLKTHASMEIVVFLNYFYNFVKFSAPPSPPTAPLESRQIGINEVIIEWGIPESDGGAPIES
jgi:hypothetical protein